jgi:hypothetical protein
MANQESRLNSGFGGRAAQAYSANRQHDHEQAEQHENVTGNHEKPVEILDGPSLGRVKELLGANGVDQGGNHKQDNKGGRYEKYRVVHIHAPFLDVVLSHLVGSGKPVVFGHACPPYPLLQL